MVRLYNRWDDVVPHIVCRRAPDDFAPVHTASDSDRAWGECCGEEQVETALHDPWHARKLRRVHISPLCRPKPVCDACGLHPHHDVLHSVPLWAGVPYAESLCTIDRSDHRCDVFLRRMDRDHDRTDIGCNCDGARGKSRDEDPATRFKCAAKGAGRIWFRYSDYGIHHRAHAGACLGALRGTCPRVCFHARAGRAGPQGSRSVGLLWPGNRITPPTHRIWRTSCCALCTSPE